MTEGSAKILTRVSRVWTSDRTSASLRYPSRNSWMGCNHFLPHPFQFTLFSIALPLDPTERLCITHDNAPTSSYLYLIIWWFFLDVQRPWRLVRTGRRSRGRRPGAHDNAHPSLLFPNTQQCLLSTAITTAVSLSVAWPASILANNNIDTY